MKNFNLIKCFKMRNVWETVPDSKTITIEQTVRLHGRMKRRGRDALAERLTASSVMHESRVRTPLILCGVRTFRDFYLFLPSQRDKVITLMVASSCLDWNKLIDLIVRRVATRCALYHMKGYTLKTRSNTKWPNFGYYLLWHGEMPDI